MRKIFSTLACTSCFGLIVHGGDGYYSHVMLENSLTEDRYFYSPGGKNSMTNPEVQSMLDALARVGDPNPR